ncbi:hypothetical protein ACFL5O_09240 [Myxococcota bacterium]
MRLMCSFSQQFPFLLVAAAGGCHLVFGDFQVDDSAVSGAGGDLRQTGQAGAGDWLGVAGSASEDDDGDASGGNNHAAAWGGLAGAPCVESARRCQEASLQQCTDGDWNEISSCASADHCDEALGYCAVCLADERRCDGQDVLRCTGARDGWETYVTCGAGEVCDPERVTCVLCTPQDDYCEEGNLVSCNGTRDGWERWPCDFGCVEVVDGPDYCAQCSTPGDSACTTAQSVQVCSEEKRWVVKESCDDECIENDGQHYCSS